MASFEIALILNALHQAGDGAAATDEVRVIRVDVAQFDVDQTLDHLFRRRHALDQQIAHASCIFARKTTRARV